MLSVWHTYTCQYILCKLGLGVDKLKIGACSSLVSKKPVTALYMPIPLMLVYCTVSPHACVTQNLLSAADGQTFPAGSFVMGLLQAVTQVLGSKAVSETGVQTAEYDGSPLSLALQQLENSYLKQTKVHAYCPMVSCYLYILC